MGFSVSGTHSFFRADFLFSSLTSWLGSRSFTAWSSVRLAGIMSNSRSLVSCVVKHFKRLYECFIIYMSVFMFELHAFTSELTPRLLSRLSWYLAMRNEKSRYRRSTVLTQRFSSVTCAWPFSTKLSASWISSFTLSLVCC